MAALHRHDESHAEANEDIDEVEDEKCSKLASMTRNVVLLDQNSISIARSTMSRQSVSMFAAARHNTGVPSQVAADLGSRAATRKPRHFRVEQDSLQESCSMTLPVDLLLGIVVDHGQEWARRAGCWPPWMRAVLGVEQGFVRQMA
ncbi:hypothetical protein ON010_g17156 [Phytophthora cinnamomi]|nr:hypothetical protein ON010_g17156 [Phytophthora cinnamomi]